MPLILRENIENEVIGLWKISEATETLLTLAKLSFPDAITYSGISAEHRKKEWLATRVLLIELIGEPHLIKYHADGRPYLEHLPDHISITHSTGYVAIQLHSTAIPGIDIELINRQVGKVASRFLSPDELAACTVNAERSNRRVLLHWCAKEAIFKMVPLSNIEFSTHIQILLGDSDFDSGTIAGIFNDKAGPVPINLKYKIVNDVLLVWGSVDKARFSM